MKKINPQRRPPATSAPRATPPYSAVKRKRPRRGRWRPKVVFPTFSLAAILAIWTLHSYCPALLLDAGHFIWGIKSSVIELGLAILAAGLSKRH